MFFRIAPEDGDRFAELIWIGNIFRVVDDTEFTFCFAQTEIAGARFGFRLGVRNTLNYESGRKLCPFQFAESQVVIAFQKKFDIQFFRRVVQSGDSFYNFPRDFRFPVERNENGINRQIIVCDFIRRDLFHAAAGERTDSRHQPDQYRTCIEQHHNSANQQNKEVAAIHQQEQQKQHESSVPELLSRGCRHSRAGIRMFLRKLARQRIQFLYFPGCHKNPRFSAI